MNNTTDSRGQAQRHVFEVSELNQNIKRILEDNFPFIWISGEISNFRIPSSGHAYFTLKDDRSQISGVLFRNQAKALKFRPEDGLSVIGLGRLSVYEPRGAYQVIFEYMEPKGVGALQIAFERLKQKLADEGLFDAKHKLALPVVPKKVSIVTSPTGAAVRDFIQVAQRRFDNLPLEVVPVSVQGERSPAEVVRAIHLLNDLATTDVIVLARGGGSIEDLRAFNDEAVGRAIFASHIPVVSAIGHETDFTIADFVADLRAPTPSAAAEIVVPAKAELKIQISTIKEKLYQTINNKLKILIKQIDSLNDRIVHPKRRLQDMRMRLDDYCLRMAGSIRETIRRRKEHAEFRHDMLVRISPLFAVQAFRERVHHSAEALIVHLQSMLDTRKSAISANRDMLNALNPMAILKRGYSITRTLPQKKIVRQATAVKLDQQLDILLGSGSLTVTVKEKKSTG
ncbi:exodeoxyribonuclease VII large subunit [Desulfosarcina ovata]|uniref:Exodeoxyribonuclease 7 large subunit n=1 Tax=Desulfosarcina ovata subsp. ovata TaxID=2752305 RepID=A0A5K8A531_9BACT|nr:exodeoxyribonuclease VII large subunit [Desulfosarcina ovata]BBO87629.1 exodeoxyribonuclease 7 large subunit [Desulfosarcina ovata subsp. ovata]